MKKFLYPIVVAALAVTQATAQEKKADEKKSIRPAEKIEADEKEKSKPAKKKETEEENVESLTKSLTDQMDSLKTEKDVLSLLNDLAEARIKESQADRREKLEEIKLRAEELEAAAKLAELESKKKYVKEIAELKRENELLTARHLVAKSKADIALVELKARETQLIGEVNRLRYEVDAKEKARTAGQYAEGEPSYLNKPLEGRTLILSDRRIPLNGTITMRTADEVCERIQYYNNKSGSYPIFIVIDDSPGGSVMAGYRILKAMEGSDAPVHVVVKSFAASMAAVITTLAEESYAYPNAVLLHHQVSSIGFGNLKQQQEGVEMLEEWWSRLAQPVADKMGVSLDDFVKKMYSKVSTGDWEEFGDEAKKLKWVNHTVDEIRETRILRNPDYKPLPSTYSTIRKSETSALPEGPTGLISHEIDSGLEEEIDENGRPFVQLPRINPYDAWWLHNPDNYYRSIP